jgi:peptide deformylase
MPLLQLVHAPNLIFKKKAVKVENVDVEIRTLIDDMFETLEFEKGVGMGANMVGVLKRIAIADLHEEGVSKPYTFINPEIYWRSEEMQEVEEASLCFAGISAKVKRPKFIKIRYLDYNGEKQELEAEGFFASVIQHEVDYLDGVTFLDHLSKMKRNILIKKMLNFLKNNQPHIHGQGCKH